MTGMAKFTAQDGGPAFGHVHQGSWRDRADPCGAMKLLSKTDGNCSRSARETREVFKSYFCNEGQVSWQWKLVSRP
ncbi:uncharacterized protein LOC144121944 isoform X2 [Amblyomma americanum]